EASVSRETRRLEGTEGRQEASHARGARCGPRGQAAADELRAADGLLDQVEVRSLAVTSSRAMGCSFPPSGAGAFLTATESSAKRTESPLQEGIHRPQVPAPAIRSTDPGRFLRVLFEFLHEFLGVQYRPRQLIRDGYRRSLGRPRERIQVDADDDLPHADQRLGAVAVLQWDEGDIRPEDPVAVGEG